MIKFGIIGCGNVAPTYLYALSRNEQAKVVAIVDTDISKAANVGNTFGIDKVYQDYKKMLADEQLDAVVICTPHFVHYSQVLDCAEKGLAILCEKPLAVQMSEIESIIEKCRNVRFSVMLQRRLYPNTIATAKAIQSGLLGNITEASLQFSCHKSPEFYNSWRGKKISGGGVLISQTLHRIDQLAFIFGDALAVEGTIKTTRPEIEVEDYAKGLIHFQNDITVSVEADNSSGNSDTLSIINIIGTHGKICLSDDKTLEWDLEGISIPVDVDINIIPTSHRPAYYGPCHEIIIDDFVDSIACNRQPMILGKHALPSMKIIFGFYEAAKQGKKIYI